jgi:hypothetical protein
MAGIDSLFQILGAAAFCAKPPYAPFGYLAVTIMEVLFSGSESDSAFFSSLASLLDELDEAIKEVHELKIITIENHLVNIQAAIKDYTDTLRRQWSSEPAPARADEDWEPSLAFFYNPQNEDDSLIKILQDHLAKLLDASNHAEIMWSMRDLYDPKGSFSLYSYYLLAVTAYLSCHRQLGSAYAMVANKIADTNRQELLSKPAQVTAIPMDAPLLHGLRDQGMSLRRPDPQIMLKAGENPMGSDQEFMNWTDLHWRTVNSHLALVTDPIVWQSDDQSHRLTNARLNVGISAGFYNQLWYCCIDLWRRAETSLSMPAEIYRHFRRVYTKGRWLYSSYGFGHGWLTVHHIDKGVSVDDYTDLLPPDGSTNEPCSRQWLDSWYEDLRKAHPGIKLANLSSNSPSTLTRDDQREYLETFRGIFGIGILDSRCTLYLLQRLRKQLMAWRLCQDVSSDISKVYAAAWPTTGELSALVARLDETIPCSWEYGADYLPNVLASLETRWNDMAGNNGTGTERNPSKLAWMQGANAWWRDRSNADQTAMPLLPETIALILEVWLASAIRADQLQKELRGKDDNYEAYDCYEYLKSRVISLDATTLQTKNDNVPDGATPMSCTFPASGLATQNHVDEDFDKASYDQHRGEIRKAWKRIRQAKLDDLLQANYGLKPSVPEASASESIVQGWSDGLIDFSDNLPLQKPEETITRINSEAGLLAPAGADKLWKEGNSISYSYQLRSLSSFKRSGSDQLSQESNPSAKILFGDEVTLGTFNPDHGIAVQIPRDRLMLARQFTLWRTITASNKQVLSKQWIGSGSFHPGQTEPSVFHDGRLPAPDPLSNDAISHAPADTQPPSEPEWIDGHFAQYQIVFFDSYGPPAPSAPSQFSTPFPIAAKAGIQVRIQPDKARLATQAQLNRRIVQVDASGTITVVGKLKAIGKGTFPVDAAEVDSGLIVMDGHAPLAPVPVVFSLQMSLKGLELVRSDAPGNPPVWSSYDPKSRSLPEVRMAILQGDGNFVLYDANRQAHWASNTMEEAGKSNSQHCLRLRANGELTIVSAINLDQVVPNGMLHAGDDKLPCDRPAVFLRSGEVMLPGQSLAIDNQSPSVSIEIAISMES